MVRKKPVKPNAILVFVCSASECGTTYNQYLYEKREERIQKNKASQVSVVRP